MDTYTVLYGGRRAKSAAQDIYAIRSREGQDDGARVVWLADPAGRWGSHTGPCPCGGVMQWAEAGYVPWHRICDHCGAHWDVHPILWGPQRPQSALPRVEWTGAYHCGHTADDADWCASCGEEAARIYREVQAPDVVRYVDGIGECPIDPLESLDPDGHSHRTWGDLLAMITPAHWASAETSRAQMGGAAVIPAGWARRARFRRG